MIVFLQNEFFNSRDRGSMKIGTGSFKMNDLILVRSAAHSSALSSRGLRNRSFPYRNRWQLQPRQISPQGRSHVIGDINRIELCSEMYVDRLGNAVLASQAIGYSQSQRLMYCMYDDVKKIVRVLSPLAPTDYYIEGLAYLII